MSDQKEFMQQMILAQEAVNSINRNSYLKNIESSITDIRIRAKLEDDPQKQNILNNELNSLLAEKNEYLLGLKCSQKRE
jgi:hypothetical protein